MRYLSLEDKELFNKTTNMHFIGISGVSMKGLALFVLNHHLNIKVSGSTNIKNYCINSIEINGDTSRLPSSTTIVVYTSCLASEHETLLANFQEKGYLTIHRSQLLNLFTQHKPNVLITGAHGKTSTTYFTYQLLKKKNYGCFIGVDLKETGTSYIDGYNAYVIEGDESDGSFQNIESVRYLLINNISTDHLENYNDSFNEYLYTFEKYLFHQKSTVIYNKNKFKQFESPVSIEESSNAYILDKLIERTKVKSISYGVENSDVNIEILESTEKLQWKLTTNKKELIYLNNKVFLVEDLYGQWNVYNMTAAIIVATLEGIEVETNIHMNKPSRRMELIYTRGNKIIFDDYAVHPTEIDNVIKLCGKKYDLKEVAFIWEPHRPSRIRRLAASFYEVFEGIESNLFVFPVFNASEKDILTSEEISQYLDYSNQLEIETLDEQIKKIIESKLYKIIVLLNAGSLSKKIREIILKISD